MGISTLEVDRRTKPVSRGHDHSDVGGVLRGDERDLRLLGDLGVGVAGLEDLQPGDIYGHDAELLYLEGQHIL